jgi:LemA protein
MAGQRWNHARDEIMTVVYIALGLIAAAVLYVIVTYNALVSLRVRVNEAWSDIEVQMKRRYNLIPNLVETVKGYAKHESGTLEKVVQARSEALANQGPPGEQARSENLLTGALKSLFALAENYPDLKANEGFLSLQNDLAEVEEKIQAARRYYNGSVRDNNTKVDQFPSNLIAGWFKFLKAEFFELDESESAARQPVKVEF